MDYVAVGLAALVLGLAAGLAFAEYRRGRASRDSEGVGGPDEGLSPRMEAQLQAQFAELRRLADADARRDAAGDRIRSEVAAFREAIQHMQVREEERRAREERGWETLHRVSAVLAGGQRAGRAGENVLRESLATLPPSMVVTDFRVNGKVVEFGLVLPDGRRLPVDSKWTAEREVQALAESEDPAERERLSRVVERAVADRAREVSAYRDSSVTAPLGVAAIPDGAYAVLRRAHADAYRFGVIVVPYSMALPVLLFLYGIVARFGGAADLEACMSDLMGVLEAVEATLENKVARATTMLANGTDELRGHLGKARGMLSRAASGPRSDDPELDGLEVPDTLEMLS